MKRQRIRSGGRAVTYREAGSGPAVVVISGLGLSGRFYDRSYGAFAAAGLRLVVPDLPGFGSTRGAPTGQDVAEASDFLLEFTRVLGIEHAIWLGHSLGAQVAIELAAGAPHRADAIVLVGPTGSPGKRKLARQAGALLREAGRAPLPVVLHVLSDYLRISPLSYIGTWLRYARDHPLAKLRRVTCPALILVGSRDPVVDPLFLDVLRRRMPAARLQQIPGATHALPRAQADAFNAAVVSFSREVLGPAPQSPRSV